MVAASCRDRQADSLRSPELHGVRMEYEVRKLAGPTLVTATGSNGSAKSQRKTETWLLAGGVAVLVSSTGRKT